MPTFYLDQLRNEPTTPVIRVLSPATIAMCLAALIKAEERENWQQGIEPLSDSEWSEAEDFLTAAIEELTGP
ncbi:MAG: hypothetical protein KDJ52_01725 [Anaerolineae bacterium]|nr:hypothetical protein [Anaerolineae bacterium]